MTDLTRFAEYDDFMAYAEATLPQPTFNHLNAGALTNWTRDENRRAYDRWVIRKRLLVDVSDTDLSTTVLGTRVEMPVLLAPSAFHKFVHPDGELATARAAKAMGTTMCLSTLSSTPLEDVAATGVDCWLQLQIHKDRGLTTELVDRAAAAGYKGIAFTVDAPNYGLKPSDRRSEIHLPTGVQIANLIDRKTLPHYSTGEDLMKYMWDEMAQDVTWDDAAWLCDYSPLPVIAKGVLSGVDAENAITAGMAAIIVSNQGGRQIDGDPATLDVLPEVLDAVDGRVEVLVDGGVRTGAHVFKALAIGARAVLLGRPQYWGLAVGGEEGLKHMLGVFREGLENTMQLAGVKRVADVQRDLVMPAPR
ncbi:alpha-hydroxy-acid oxidizing protein [Svornostia abyssi]|uniref:Alpha-hydroxy-acid oxidizing protein n=1 Tax=Svornostia abyssi TaxID=2898438 RepID=A0ABY5PCS0_9ACTN|nr:alpha-hydroxy-acid oxidizing protein [Parviterribacteraceae bacterium J379]